jgi:hypothetical protein
MQYCQIRAFNISGKKTREYCVFDKYIVMKRTKERNFGQILVLSRCFRVEGVKKIALVSHSENPKWRLLLY